MGVMRVASSRGDDLVAWGADLVVDTTDPVELEQKQAAALVEAEKIFAKTRAQNSTIVDPVGEQYLTEFDPNVDLMLVLTPMSGG